MKISEAIAARARHAEITGTITRKEHIPDARTKLAKANLEDESGSITLNLWRNQVEQCQEGDTVRVTDAYVKFFRGVPELNTWNDIEVLE